MAIKLKCKHCEHIWNYKGKNPYLTTCPYCSWKVYLKSSEVLECLEK
jgi:DNA-directed RNA polymerase subunit RPC12/RpoP